MARPHETFGNQLVSYCCRSWSIALGGPTVQILNPQMCMLKVVPLNYGPKKGNQIDRYGYPLYIALYNPPLRKIGISSQNACSIGSQLPKSRSLGYVTIGYVEPRTHGLGSWRPRVMPMFFLIPSIQL